MHEFAIMRSNFKVNQHTLLQVCPLQNYDVLLDMAKNPKKKLSEPNDSPKIIMLSGAAQSKAPSLGFVPLKAEILAKSKAAVNKIGK